MNIIILGPQGCGKGTQAKLLAEKLNLAHIEMGAALREQAKEETPLGEKIDEIINKKGELVPDDLIAEVIREAIRKVPEDKGIILDGAPRKISQIKIVENSFRENNRQLDKVIFINLSEEESINRITKRAHCSKCGKNLIIGKDIDKVDNNCPDCEGGVTQRKDDTMEGLKRRLAIFKQETVPVIKYYEDKGMLMEVDGGQGVEKVFNSITTKLN